MEVTYHLLMYQCMNLSRCAKPMRDPFSDLLYVCVRMHVVRSPRVCGARGCDTCLDGKSQFSNHLNELRSGVVVEAIVRMS